MINEQPDQYVDANYLNDGYLPTCCSFQALISLIQPITCQYLHSKEITSKTRLRSSSDRAKTLMQIINVNVMNMAFFRDKGRALGESKARFSAHVGKER
ncbi:hypothetical protein IO699_003705 [Vibrio parahaemolyticus]|nr:hypothetical protein [Vibrio parahaemolyticus]